MRTRSILIIAAIACFARTTFAQTHQHHSHAPPIRETKSNHGKKWEADKPLRRGMERINELVKENESTIRNKNQTEEAYRRLAGKLKSQTDYIFKNCKLPPSADEALHRILISVLNAEDVFSSKASDVEKQKAFEALIRALDQYGSEFDHEGWQTTK